MSNALNHAKEFLTRSAQNDSTEVCSETAPEIVQEHIKQNERVETVEAIDRERHVHHHQHRVQPIVDKQVLDTKHEFNVLPEVTRESKHDMIPEHRAKLEEQRNLYHNTQTAAPVVREQVAGGVQANEHVHHHVHETIQPVIQRETVASTHVHTTIPIHEKIHDAPVVHEMTTLPTVTLDEFKSKAGGVHAHSHRDGDHSHQYYEGSPRVGGPGASEGTSATGRPGTTTDKL
ncbi:hypothetical protein QFC24_002643 [Naganishia onofrii]|uniref:Uncharacterized protein n=1 Tax=Naganishia onofrii TaxID=1851511 RepID=A0ACC2XP93_9TREE|nr:hypothetical protein QFC24_002643 [Naganishia onofrii]